MIYLYTNKSTSETRAFGSLVALCSNTGLKKDRFYTHFGRNKNTEYENKDVKIIKVELERSKHEDINN